MRNTVYRIIVSDEVQESLNNYLKYTIEQYQDYFAALSILNDYHQTLKRLQIIGDGLQVCNSPIAKRVGIRKIRFKKHNFYLFYVVEGNAIKILRAYSGRQNHRMG